MGVVTPNQVAVAEGMEWVESSFTFKTKVGRVEGVLRLTPDSRGTWKCYVSYTSLPEITGHELLENGRRGRHKSTQAAEQLLKG
jgi:hypothetical protein